jgi:hypothetical protein
MIATSSITITISTIVLPRKDESATTNMRIRVNKHKHILRSDQRSYRGNFPDTRDGLVPIALSPHPLSG